MMMEKQKGRASYTFTFQQAGALWWWCVTYFFPGIAYTHYYGCYIRHLFDLEWVWSPPTPIVYGAVVFVWQ